MQISSKFNGKYKIYVELWSKNMYFAVVNDGVEDFYILTMLVILLNFMVESGHGSFLNFLTTGVLQAGRNLP